MHWLDLQDSGLKCFCFQEGLSGGLEPEGGRWAVQHSWLDGEQRGTGGGGLWGRQEACEQAGRLGQAQFL